MSLSNADLVQILLALLVILISAHSVGFLFQRMRQPVVIGEILGGLILGPTVAGFFFPEAMSYVFFENLATKTLLAALSQLGLVFLMFSSGLEMRSLFKLKEAKTSLLIASVGSILPFLVAVIAVKSWDFSHLFGPAQNSSAFLLIFAASVAVTSIPVISRIFIDLGIIDTSFARIVLTAAVLEDIVLYIVIGLALALVDSSISESSPLWRNLQLEPGSTASFLGHITVHCLFFAFVAVVGSRIFRSFANSSWNAIAQKSSVAYLLVSLFLVTIFAILLGISPMFGAFAAGIMVGSAGDHFESSGDIIRKNAFSFSIPIYFAMVGLKLNLVKSFDLSFFLMFFICACFVKAVSVYLAARIARESNQGAWNFAVSMNARGGPGIVLASVAFEAKIINEVFYTTLVLLAILSSLGAGAWLGKVVRKNMPLR